MQITTRHITIRTARDTASPETSATDATQRREDWAWGIGLTLLAASALVAIRLHVFAPPPRPTSAIVVQAPPASLPTLEWDTPASVSFAVPDGPAPVPSPAIVPASVALPGGATSRGAKPTAAPAPATASPDNATHGAPNAVAALVGAGHEATTPPVSGSVAPPVMTARVTVPAAAVPATTMPVATISIAPTRGTASSVPGPISIPVGNAGSVVVQVRNGALELAAAIPSPGVIAIVHEAGPTVSVSFSAPRGSGSASFSAALSGTRIPYQITG